MDDVIAGTRESQRGYTPLIYRVLGVNLVLLVAAVVITIALIAPSRLSPFRLDAELVVLTISLLVLVAVNAYLVRMIVGPVQALTGLARRVDLSGNVERISVPAAQSEALELAVTFNEMLARLEAERLQATGRVLAAQEAERLRIARELHDQIGQDLTAVLLQLWQVESHASADLRGDLINIQGAVRDCLEEVRQIAVELRPEALDDLGLKSALMVMCQRFAERSGLDVTQDVAPDLCGLPEPVELVVYRVAQEALTNVARHAGVQAAHLGLTRANDLLVLTVSDAGRGLPTRIQHGAGMRGMRERAMLVGGHLAITSDPSGGCRVQLDVPLADPADGPREALPEGPLVEPQSSDGAAESAR